MDLFAATELEQPLWRISRHTALYDEDERIRAEVPLAERDFRRMAEVLENHLSRRRFTVGTSFSASDIVCAYTLDWANEIDLLDGFPHCQEYLERQYQRDDAPPRIAAALARVRANYLPRDAGARAP